MIKGIEFDITKSLYMVRVVKSWFTLQDVVCFSLPVGAQYIPV